MSKSPALGREDTAKLQTWNPPAIADSAHVKGWDATYRSSLQPRQQRRNCRIHVSMIVANHDCHGMVTNLSLGGVRLQTDTIVRLRSSHPVTIICRELGTVVGIVRWCAHPHYGLEFDAAGKRSAQVREYFATLEPDPDDQRSTDWT